MKKFLSVAGELILPAIVVFCALVFIQAFDMVFF